MRKTILTAALLFALASINLMAQANTTNASTVGSAATNDPNAVGNDRIGRGKVAGSKPKSTGATVDGSNGSATNDGASGQSGAPAPLPPATTPQSVKRSTTTTHKTKGGHKSSVSHKMPRS